MTTSVPLSEKRTADGAKKAKKTTVTRKDDKTTLELQRAKVIATEKLSIEAKTMATQTSPTSSHSKEKVSPEDTLVDESKNSSSSSLYLEQKKSSNFWSADEDPAPQWLIEEALNRGSEVCKEYEAVILELERKLSRTREELDEALRTKSIAKEKYKRTLENLKEEAYRENEIQQERIVRICTSVLENFGPRAMSERGKKNVQPRSHRRLRCHEKVANKLYKKLRITVVKSTKLKQQLITTRKALREKSAKYDSMTKCFNRLKQEMGTTEINLNNLIAENISLRKKIDDTRDWVELKIGKEQHERTNAAQFREMQKNRELINLKKKAEEDCTAITQLRNKLLRSESANANKGFLLNSYKAQLTDLNKEKDQLLTKINNLENENNIVRNNNVQLKKKISLLNNEKGKLISGAKISNIDFIEKAERQYAKTCEVSNQEIDDVKAKCDETVKMMRIKINDVESQNSEYLRAIKELLKKIYDHHEEREVEWDLSGSERSEREAHETACNILNMTPEELSGFIKGKPNNSINSWLSELHRIVLKSHFSESLSKFLFKKAMKKERI